jgi:class 3 adenylate cyclase
VNQFDREILATLVKANWMEDACTAAFVTTLQEFRHAFSAEVLRPGQELTVGAVALLFTDLKGSTAMYQRIGDATAFRLVRDHFDILMECVRRNNGGIVKTIGDAVMAAFLRADDAVRAAIEMHQGIEEKNALESGTEKLRVKVGIHYGPCYAVNLNERLDYFGATVNIAARTEGQCEGGDIVISKEAFNEAGVQAAIEGAGLNASRMIRSLKGFEREFELYKIPCIGYSQTLHGTDGSNTRSA